MQTTREYTARDGMNVLTYLGFTRFNQAELDAFEQFWDEAYNLTGKRLLRTVAELYAEAMPFGCGYSDEYAATIGSYRHVFYWERVKQTRIDKMLVSGASLERILATAPHRFAHLN